MTTYWVALMTTALTVPAFGYERQHSSHEHGVATMQLVIEGKTLQLKIETPAMNILGFEHEPNTAEQKNAIKQADALLKNSDNVVLLPKAAKCQLTKVNIESSLFHNEHEHEHEEGDSAHSDSHNEDSGHTDYDLDYQYECDNIKALQQLGITLFSHFPLFEELEVQYIVPLETGFGQGVKHLTPAESRFKF